jgi:hypothetical protein
MKIRDIEAGVVYVHRPGKFGSARPVVLLAEPGPHQLYAARRNLTAIRPYFEHRPHDTKPRRGNGATGEPRVGWPAVFAYRVEPVAYDLEEMTKVTLAEFLAATTVSDPERGITFGLVVRSGDVVGLYETAVDPCRGERVIGAPLLGVCTKPRGHTTADDLQEREHFDAVNGERWTRSQ